MGSQNLMWLVLYSLYVLCITSSSIVVLFCFLLLLLSFVLGTCYKRKKNRYLWMFLFVCLFSVVVLDGDGSF